MHRLAKLMIPLIAAGAFGAAGVAGALTQSAPPSPNAGVAPPPARAARASTPAFSETAYVAITPCRIVDTRVGARLVANAVRTFYVRGTTHFAPQGGKAGGCGVPDDATAAALSFTTIDSTGAGKLNAWPTGTTEPLNTTVSYTAAKTTTAATVKLSAQGTDPHMTVRNSYAATHVVVDVVGYYAPPIHAVLAPTGGIYSGSPRVLSSTQTGTGSYQVQVDRDPTNCTPIASVNGSSYFASSYVSGSFIYANTYSPSGTLTNVYWTLTLIC